jgi:hypothetical protein
MGVSGSPMIPGLFGKNLSSWSKLPSPGVVKYHAQGVPVPAANPADAVTKIHAIHAASARHRALMHRENYRVSLAKRHDFGPRLQARPLFGDDEFAPGEVRTRLRQQDRDLQRKDARAVEILVQAVVVTSAVLKQ